MKEEQMVRDCSLVKRTCFFFKKNRTLPEFLILELFSLESLMTKCLIQRVGAVISEREKNNRLKETTTTSEHTRLLVMRTRCLLQSCLN